MWVTRHTPRALRGSLQRIFSMLAAALIVVVFTCLTLSVTPAYAEAQWTGGSIGYEGHSYQPVASPPRIPNSTNAYQWIDTSQTPNKAYVLYFNGKPDSKVATQASLVIYDHPGYTGGTTATAINVQPDLNIAIWTGSKLSYKNNSYQPVASPPRIPNSTNAYQWIDTVNKKAYVLYFSAPNPQAATSAQLVVYDDPGYKNGSAPTTIEVTRDLTVDADGQNKTTAGTTCSGDATKGLGWILCPISNYLADGVDSVYKIIEDFLEVRPIMKANNGIYDLWDLVRSIANVCFVIVFLAIIYSQITGAGLSNHNIKHMLPRLVVGAVLVNLSFIISGLAVDASNLLGHSIQAVLVNIRENVAMTSPDLLGISWTQFTNALLTGGAITVGGLGFAAATGGSLASLFFILIGMLVTAGLSILVAFAILAARQALITIFVIISPLAFIAFVLPSTQSLFDKWRKAFTTLLLFFPLFALLFGGSQLAGTAIINAEAQAGQDARLHIILIGLAVQVIPLALTPLIVRFSTGVLATFAQFANNSKRGLVDRAKNWATDNADYHKKNKQAKTAFYANPANRRNPFDARGIARVGLWMDQSKRHRDLRNKDSDDLLQGRASARHGELLDNNALTPRTRIGRRRAERLRHQRHMAHDYNKQAETYNQDVASEGDQHWSHNLHGAHGNYARLRHLRTRTEHQKGMASLYDEAMTNADKRASGQAIYQNNHLRYVATHSAVDAKETSAYQDAIAQHAESDWVDRQLNVAVLRTMRQQSLIAKNRAAAIDTAMTTEDQRRFDENVEAGMMQGGVDYAQIQDAVVQSGEDTRVSKLYTSNLEAQANENYQRLFINGSAEAARMQRVYRETVAAEKTAGELEGTLKDRAEARWEQQSRTDTDLQAMRLTRTRAADSLVNQQKQYEKLIENSRAKGKAAPGIAAGNESIADALQSVYVSNVAQDNAIDQAKLAQSAMIAEAFKESQLNDPNHTLLKEAAGIGGDVGMTSIYAKAKEQVINTAVEQVKKTNKALTGDMTRKQLQKLYRKGIMPDGSKATTEMRQSAMYVLLQDKGNNQDAQNIRDSIAQMGMMMDDNGNYFEPKRDADGFLIRNADGWPEADTSKPITDPDEISTRRDWQQFFDDAMTGSPHSMGSYSGTNKSEARAGTMVDGTRDGYMRDATGGKFSPEKILKADVDELKILLDDMNSPKGYYQRMTPEQQKTADKTIASAILRIQSDPFKNNQIDDRNRGVMNDLLYRINPSEYAPTIGPNNERLYRVNKDKSIISAGTPPQPDEEQFRAPINVPGAYNKDGTPWTGPDSDRYFDTWEADPVI